MKRDTAELIVSVYMWFMWISAALGVLGGLALLFAPAAFRGLFTGDPLLGTLFSGLGIGLGVFVLAMALFDLFVGIGLRSRRPWARIAMLVLAVLSLFAFPLGTVYGVVTIWLFGFDDTVKGLFEPVTAQYVERRKKSRTRA